MVDDNYSRPPRDPYGRQDARQDAEPSRPHNDPLAELARLIGQNEQFASLTANAQARNAQPAASYQAEPEPDADWESVRAAFPPPEPFPDPRAPSYGDERYDQSHPYNPAADPYAVAQPSYPAQDAGYYADGRAHDDDAYDDNPPGRPRWMILAGAAAAALLVTVGSVYAYRAIFSSSRSSQPPPVIRADTAPSKVVPPPQTDPVSGKLIQDRLGDRTQSERVVSREEQPVDVNRAPSRVIFPGPNVPASNVAPAGDGKGALAQGAVALSSTEPKKIRTIPIKPDQAGAPSDTAGAAAAAAAAARVNANGNAPTRVASAPPVDNGVDVNANAGAPPPAARPAAPRPAAPPAAAPASNGPLSLTPDAGAPAAPTRTASVPPPRAAAPAASGSVAPGSYVQVSSQRSEADARASFQTMKAKYPAVLGNREATVREVDLGEKGTYYRAMVGPFASSDQAAELCMSLKAAGGSCIVQRN